MQIALDEGTYYVVDMRYQKMKDQFGSLFDLLKEVE